MCGFIASVVRHGKVIDPIPLKRALNQMQRRGPDAEEVWQEPAVLFGHRRLSIQDLDVRSKQPMHSACGRYVSIFNGEIYNFQALGRDLVNKEGVQFQTTSDTEVLLALFARHSAAMLPLLRGMFAFVIWDRTTRRAFAARDPYGIKPLYWSKTNDGVLLCSQAKALLATGLVSTAPSARGEAGFWLLGSVPEPHTWYKDIQTLQAGHYAWIENGRISEPQRWWDTADAWRAAGTVLPSRGEIVERSRQALRESVKAHLVADVPVGVFLSGGIDSGALAGLMVEAGAKNLQGITIAFDEFTGTHNDEALPANILAKHYGITHHVRRVTRTEFEADLPRILAAMDQPTIDGINTWYASKAVAELGLKVVVSGVGGDELFQGYDSFRHLPRLVSAQGVANRIPGATAILRAAPGFQARRSGNARWHHLPDWASTLPGAWFLRRGLFAPSELPALMGTEQAAQGLQSFSPDDWIHEMCGQLPVNPELALGLIESKTYILNQLLRDSDWASMDHSVELRTPLVDAWLLRDLQPLLPAFNQFPNKHLLAEAPDKSLPDTLIKRRKTGFSIPVKTWLKQMGKAGDKSRKSNDWAREVASQFR